MTNKSLISLPESHRSPRARKRPEKAYEHPDPTPMALPVNYCRPATLRDQIRQMVRSERFAQAQRDRGAETFEEADDFDCGDDSDPRSPYESDFEPNEAPEVSAKVAEAEARALNPPRSGAAAPAPKAPKLKREKAFDKAFKTPLNPKPNTESEESEDEF